MDFDTVSLTKGYKLYRGSAQAIQPITRQMWFTQDPKEAQIYGNVKEYELVTPVNLVRLDMVDNILKLTAVASEKDPQVVTAIKSSFQLYDNTLIRNSESHHDKAILNFICRLGFNGFFSQPIHKSTDNNVFFHSEIGLCDARKQINLVKSIDLGFNPHGADMHAYKLKEARDAALTKRHWDDDADDYKPRRLF